MSVVRVFGSPLSQPTRSVLWTCSLVGVQPDFKVVNANDGEQTSVKFLQKNPNGKFPVLEHDDYVLWESNAIMRYVVEVFGDDKIRKQYYPPSNPKLRARIDAWMEWKHSHIRPGAAGLVRRRVMANIMKEPIRHSLIYDLREIPESREERILMDALKVLEEQLAKADFLIGDNATLADIAIATEVDQLRLLKSNATPPAGNDLSNHPNVKNWLNRMHSLPGFKESHNQFEKVVSKITQMHKASKL